MSVVNKLFNRLTFRCLGAVGAGVFVAALFSALLSAHGGGQDHIAPVTTARTLAFPENEKMLKDVSAQLAREGEALSKIAPAAGGDSTSTPVR